MCIHIQMKIQKNVTTNTKTNVITNTNKAQIQVYIYDREYIWVRAQHLDDGGGGPRLLCSSYPLLHCIIRCQNCPGYVHRLVHMDFNVTRVKKHFQQF